LLAEADGNPVGGERCPAEDARPERNAERRGHAALIQDLEAYPFEEAP
jgi:hypothetical protein